MHISSRYLLREGSRNKKRAKVYSADPTTPRIFIKNTYSPLAILAPIFLPSTSLGCSLGSERQRFSPRLHHDWWFATWLNVLCFTTAASVSLSCQSLGQEVKESAWGAKPNKGHFLTAIFFLIFDKKYIKDSSKRGSTQRESLATQKLDNLECFPKLA